MSKPIISVVIGTYNRLNFLKLFLDSLREEMKGFLYETIIIDGSSTDGTLPWLTEQKDVILILQHNRDKWMGKEIERKSWGYFMNLGFKCAQGKYICMLSDDCLIVPGAIINGYNLFEQKLKDGLNIGAIAFYFRDYPGRFKYRVASAQGNKISVNNGMYLKKAVEEVGYFDEENYFFYYTDPDLALKLWQKGYLIIDSPNSYIEHFLPTNLEIRKFNEENAKKDQDNYLKKWEGVFNSENCNYVNRFIEKDYNDKSLTAKKFPKLSLENVLKFTVKNKIKDWIKSLIPKKYHSKIKQLINNKSV